MSDSVVLRSLTGLYARAIRMRRIQQNLPTNIAVVRDLIAKTPEYKELVELEKKSE